VELRSEQRIELTPGEVWESLNDPNALKLCIPLCESVQKISEREFRVAMMAAVGPVRARFTAKLEYTKLDAPHSCSMVFEGQGGPAGFGKGEAQLVLTPEGGATVLSYHINAQIGGKLAQIGSRLVDAAARKMADDFFAKFNDVVVASRLAVSAPAGAVGEIGAVPAGLCKSRLIWLAAALLAGGLLYYYLR
jgi:carbon monoxide dehydrogenase subunit G